MCRYFRLLPPLTVLAAGLLLAAGDTFLAAWRAAAGDAHDIAARGPWLLVLYVPFFVLGTALVIGLLLLPLARRHQLAPWPRVLLPVTATVAAAVVLYADPYTVVWRVLGPLRLALGPLGGAALDGLLVLAGLALLWRLRPTVRAGHLAAV